MLGLLVLTLVLAFTAVCGLSFPFLITAMYTAFFIFFMFIFEHYQTIQIVQIDYTHLLLLQIASSFSLVYVISKCNDSGSAYVFASLQCLSILVNIFFLLCYIYTIGAFYTAVRDYYMALNDALLCADLVALIGCVYGDFKRHTNVCT